MTVNWHHVGPWSMLSTQRSIWRGSMIGLSDGACHEHVLARFIGKPRYVGVKTSDEKMMSAEI